MGTTLMDLDIDQQQLEHQINEMLEESEGEITEEIDALMDRMMELDFAVAGKLDRYGYIIDKQQKESQIIAERIKALQVRKRVSENKIRRMKERLRFFMVNRDVKKVEGEYFSFTRRMKGGKLALIIEDGVDPERLPPMFVCTKTEIDNDAVRDFLKDAELEWARLKPREEGVVMK